MPKVLTLTSVFHAKTNVEALDKLSLLKAIDPMPELKAYIRMRDDGEFEVVRKVQKVILDEDT